MAMARLYMGEAWPVLYVEGPTHWLDSDRTAYEVDGEALKNYNDARKKLLNAERELLESISTTDPYQLMELEMRSYLENLPKE